MSATVALLSSLEAITYETVQMLAVLEDEEQTSDRREAKRRVLEIRAKAQELLDWLAEVRLEEPRN